MRSGAGQQRGVHGTTWFMFVSHKIQRFRPQMCEITSRWGCWGPSRNPTIARTQTNPGVRWQLKPTAVREWVVYTITDRIKHVCLSAVRQVRVLQKHTSRNKNPSQYLENAHGVRACAERARVYTHTYIPTKTSDHFFLRFSEMLQGGHLLSWYHEILHARLSPVLPPLKKKKLKKEETPSKKQQTVSCKDESKKKWWRYRAKKKKNPVIRLGVKSLRTIRVPRLCNVVVWGCWEL